jgi:hypothetical protein
MHILAVLLFLGVLVLALGVIRDMLVTHGEQIITALIGERVFPAHSVDVIKFRARSASESERHRHQNMAVAIRSSPPLALAA